MQYHKMHLHARGKILTAAAGYLGNGSHTARGTRIEKRGITADENADRRTKKKHVNKKKKKKR